MTTYCYQINGGTCRNPVSAEAKFSCAAGHGRVSVSKDLERPTFVSLPNLLDAASSTLTSLEDLMRLAVNQSHLVRERAAQNPRTPLLSQMGLAKDNNERVQLGLLANREPIDIDDIILEILMSSRFSAVRAESSALYEKINP